MRDTGTKRWERLIWDKDPVESSKSGSSYNCQHGRRGSYERGFARWWARDGSGETEVGRLAGDGTDRNGP